MVGVIIVKADAAFDRSCDAAVFQAVAEHTDHIVRLWDHDLSLNFSARQNECDHTVVKAVSCLTGAVSDHVFDLLVDTIHIAIIQPHFGFRGVGVHAVVQILLVLLSVRVNNTRIVDPKADGRLREFLSLPFRRQASVFPAVFIPGDSFLHLFYDRIVLTADICRHKGQLELKLLIHHLLADILAQCIGRVPIARFTGLEFEYTRCVKSLGLIHAAFSRIRARHLIDGRLPLCRAKVVRLIMPRKRHDRAPARPIKFVAALHDSIILFDFIAARGQDRDGHPIALIRSILNPAGRFPAARLSKGD